MLYRSPSVIIDDHEWHLTARVDYGHVLVTYYFRPLSRVRYRWQPITSWEGKKPKLTKFFLAHIRHARAAADNHKRRDEIIAKREARAA